MTRNTHMKALCAMLLWTPVMSARIIETPIALGISEQMSFEKEDMTLHGQAKGWWDCVNTVWNRSNEQASDGSYSMKFSLPAQSDSRDYTLQSDYKISGGDNTPVLESGKNYRLKLDVYIEDGKNQDFQALHIYFQNDALWKDISITGVDKVTKGKWITLHSKDFSVDKQEICKLLIKPNGEIATNNEALFYIDHIQLVEITEEANTGFGDPDMMNFEQYNPDINGGCEGWWAFNPNNWFRSEDKAVDGTASLCCSVEQNSELFDPWIQSDQGSNEDDKPNAPRILEKGSYVLRYSIYLEPDANAGLQTFYVYFSMLDEWIPVTLNNIQELEKGRWLPVELNFDVNKAPTTGKLILKINNDACQKDKVKFYVDNFTIEKKIESSLPNNIIKCSVYALHGKIIVKGFHKGSAINIYNLSGVNELSDVIDSEVNSFSVTPGIHLVKINNLIEKVNL